MRSRDLNSLSLIKMQPNQTNKRLMNNNKTKQNKQK